jgi:hypothetical protein
MLNEVFGMSVPEVAAVVGRSPAAVRQLGVRARAHVAAGAPRVDVVEGEHSRTVAAFLAAAGNGDNDCPSWVNGALRDSFRSAPGVTQVSTEWSYEPLPFGWTEDRR